MYDAHCICPNMVVNYVTESSFYNYLTRSESQIILDENGLLYYEYIQAIGENNPEKFQALKCIFKYLELTSNKILKVNSSIDDNTKRMMLDITMKAVTTFNKSFLVCDNNDYSDYLQELIDQNIQLFNHSNLERLLIGTPTILSGALLNHNKMMEDLEFALYKLIRTQKTGHTEDELNDYIRDILEAKHYAIRDQTREGTSTSGHSSGELDLVILDNSKLYAIIEAMKLSSVDREYINTHYKKLLINYNPLGVKKTFLVSYYTGKDFNSFCLRYEDYIRNIDPTIFEENEISLEALEEKNVSYVNMKKYVHNIIINEIPAFCVHYIIKI